MSEAAEAIKDAGKTIGILNLRRNVKIYLQLAKPERTLTNVFTAAAGFLFANRWHGHWLTLLELLVGSTLIIASACVFNNLLDRGMDKKMERTKKRALVKGVIKTNSAVLYAAILGLLGFWALAYTNWLTFWIGVAAFVGYVGLYDLAKRHTVHSTLIGTLPGGASLVAGYTAVTNRLDARACLLFIIMAAWQMAHFYAIAVYRRDDYAKAGLPVMSVKHGIKATKFQIIFYIVIFGIAAIFLDGYGKKSYIYVTLAGAVSAYWLVRSLINYRNQESTKWARTVFKDSLMVLMVLMVAIAASPLLP